MKKQLLLLFVVLCSMAATVTKSYAQANEFWFAPPVMYFASGGGGYPYRSHGGFVLTNATNRQAYVRIEYAKNSTDTTFMIPPYSYDTLYYRTFSEIEAISDISQTELGTIAGDPNFSAGIHITSTNAPVSGYYLYKREYGGYKQ